MITEPTTLLALALCVGILGLVVLILPLLILFWSQMEPQLVGLIGAGGNEKDEYPSQSVLPRLMRSFGHMAEIEKEQEAKKPARKAPAKSSSRKAAPTSRSNATTSSKSVKPAPAKTKKSASKSASTATKAKATSTATAKTAEAAKKPAAKSAKPKPAARRTPAGAKRDPILGIVYSKKPKAIDDLKEIKGVAKVIEAKLHKAGVYTFRQIVEWDDAAIDAFSEKLSFKGRIRNEDWQTQCAKFHKDKYDQKIG